MELHLQEPYVVVVGDIVTVSLAVRAFHYWQSSNLTKRFPVSQTRYLPI